MRRLFALVAVAAMMVALAVAPAFARGANNYTICHDGRTYSGLSYKTASWYVRNDPGDYWGACVKHRHHHTRWF